MFTVSVLPSCPVFNATSTQDARTKLVETSLHSGTRTFALLTQKQHPKRYLAISVLNGPTPYLLWLAKQRRYVYGLFRLPSTLFWHYPEE